MRLNREIKAFCPDFEPMRNLLRNAGAEFIETKEQVDHYYNLPEEPDQPGPRRLKLRYEHGRSQAIYYEDRQEGGFRSSHFQVWDSTDNPLKEVLDTALGVKAVVRKTRELWRKENVVFNLDTVDGVGQVFEVEVQALAGHDVDQQIEQYEQLFGLYMGERIAVSNEDLVSGSSPPSPR